VGGVSVADIFISYDTEDRDLAAKLARRFGETGFSVWWDRQIKHGKYFDQEIEQELNAARAAIVVWSPDSIASNWVRAEAASALNQGKLFPISIKGAKPPLQFTHVQTGDFSRWKGRADDQEFASLVGSLDFQPGALAPARSERKNPAAKHWVSKTWLRIGIGVGIALMMGWAAVYFPTCGYYFRHESNVVGLCLRFIGDPDAWVTFFNNATNSNIGR
jgi:hypothetical protein